MVATKSDRAKALATKRAVLRDKLWPDSANEVWSRHNGKGFTTIPRVLPLVMTLIGTLAKKGNPGAVYLDLWARSFDEGLVTVTDENDFAYSSGYTGPRASRTWKEHLKSLRDLGFIKTAEQGNRDIAHVLLLDPYKVCSRLNADGKIQKAWWNAFVVRMAEIGAEFTQGETPDLPLDIFESELPPIPPPPL